MKYCSLSFSCKSSFQGEGGTSFVFQIIGWGRWFSLTQSDLSVQKQNNKFKIQLINWLMDRFSCMAKKVAVLLAGAAIQKSLCKFQIRATFSLTDRGYSCLRHCKFYIRISHKSKEEYWTKNRQAMTLSHISCPIVQKRSAFQSSSCAPDQFYHLYEAWYIKFHFSNVWKEAHIRLLP